MQEDRVSYDVDFELQSIQDNNGDRPGALILLDPSREAVSSFLGRLMEIKYPPGERSNSTLSVSSRPLPDFVWYETSSSLGTSSTEISGISENVADLVQRTLTGMGSIPIVFGTRTVLGFELPAPRRNCTYVSSVMLNGELQSGRLFPQPWDDFMGLVHDTFEIFE